MHNSSIDPAVIDRVTARRGGLRVFDSIDPAKTAHVVIDIQFAPGHLIPERARETLRLVFATNPHELTPDLSYWQPCLSGIIKADPSVGGRGFCFERWKSSRDCAGAIWRGSGWTS